MDNKNTQEKGESQSTSTEPVQHVRDQPSSGEVKTRRTWAFEAKAVLVVLITLLAYFVLSGYFNRANNYGAGSEEAQASVVPSVVVLDLYGLQQAKLQQLQSEELPFETVAREAEEFARKLHAVLNDYRFAGMIVLNRNAVVATPETLDVTRVIAGRLGVNYSPSIHRGGSGDGVEQ